MEDKKTRTTKKINLLTSVESIVYLAKGSKLNKEFYRKADKYLKYMSEKLELTKEESVISGDLFKRKVILARFHLGEIYTDCQSPSLPTAHIKFVLVQNSN